MDYPNDPNDQDRPADGETNEQCKREDALEQVQPEAESTPRAGETNGLRITEFVIDENEIDFAAIAEGSSGRFAGLWGCSTGYYYLDPLVTVYTPVLSLAFSEKVRESQLAWCRRFAKLKANPEFRLQESKYDVFEPGDVHSYEFLVIDGKLSSLEEAYLVPL